MRMFMFRGYRGLIGGDVIMGEGLVAGSAMPRDCVVACSPSANRVWMQLGPETLSTLGVLILLL